LKKADMFNQSSMSLSLKMSCVVALLGYLPMLVPAYFRPGEGALQ